MSDVTHRGWRAASHTKTFFSALLSSEVCIRSEVSFPIVVVRYCVLCKGKAKDEGRSVPIGRRSVPLEAVCRLRAGKGKANAKMQRIFLPPDVRNDARTSYLCSPKTNPMKVIVDDKIPFIREALESLADEVVYAPGKDFTPALVRDADALVTRTRTRCDPIFAGRQPRALHRHRHHRLRPHRHRLVPRAGIAWANAPGCNADSVAQYLQSALLLWQQATGNALRTLTWASWAQATWAPAWPPWHAGWA